jgi:hypothetical protein
VSASLDAEDNELVQRPHHKLNSQVSVRTNLEKINYESEHHEGAVVAATMCLQRQSVSSLIVPVVSLATIEEFAKAGNASSLVALEWTFAAVLSRFDLAGNKSADARFCRTTVCPWINVGRQALEDSVNRLCCVSPSGLHIEAVKAALAVVLRSPEVPRRATDDVISDMIGFVKSAPLGVILRQLLSWSPLSTYAAEDFEDSFRGLVRIMGVVVLNRLTPLPKSLSMLSTAEVCQVVYLADAVFSAKYCHRKRISGRHLVAINFSDWTAFQATVPPKWLIKLTEPVFQRLRDVFVMFEWVRDVQPK